jgi:hypothetical protein
METHVKVLGVLYLVLSALYLLVALFLAATLGGTAGIVSATAEPEDAAIAIPVLGIAGTALVIFLVVFALPGLLTGYGLLKYKPWARILGIVLSAMSLVNVPLGTIAGAYGLWVLLNKETERLFDGAPP